MRGSDQVEREKEGRERRSATKLLLIDEFSGHWSFFHASSEGEASSALESSPQSGCSICTASRVCAAPKQLTEPWPRPFRCPLD